jgi:hypothetical protein
VEFGTFYNGHKTSLSATRGRVTYSLNNPAFIVKINRLFRL